MCIGDFCGFNEGYEIELMASDQVRVRVFFSSSHRRHRRRRRRRRCQATRSRKTRPTSLPPQRISSEPNSQALTTLPRQSAVPSSLSPNRKTGGKFGSPNDKSSPNREPSVEEMLGPEFATSNKNRFGGGNDDREGPKGPGEASYVITYR